MKCPNCHREIPQETRFCGFCGAPVYQEKTHMIADPAGPGAKPPKKRRPLLALLVAALILVPLALGALLLWRMLAPKPPQVHSYALYTGAGGWEEAKRRAAESGGYLAQLDDREEFDALTARLDADGYRDEAFLLGARSEAGSPDYYWNDPSRTADRTPLNSADAWCADLWDDRDALENEDTSRARTIRLYYNSAAGRWVIGSREIGSTGGTKSVIEIQGNKLKKSGDIVPLGPVTPPEPEPDPGPAPEPDPEPQPEPEEEPEDGAIPLDWLTGHWFCQNIQSPKAYRFYDDGTLEMYGVDFLHDDDDNIDFDHTALYRMQSGSYTIRDDILTIHMDQESYHQEYEYSLPYVKKSQHPEITDWDYADFVPPDEGFFFELDFQPDYDAIPGGGNPLYLAVDDEMCESMPVFGGRMDRESSPPEAPAADGSLRSAYAQVVRQCAADCGYGTPDELQGDYSGLLHDLDGDGTEELLLSFPDRDEFDVAVVEIWTWRNGKAKKLLHQIWGHYAGAGPNSELYSMQIDGKPSVAIRMMYGEDFSGNTEWDLYTFEGEDLDPAHHAERQWTMDYDLMGQMNYEDIPQTFTFILDDAQISESEYEALAWAHPDPESVFRIGYSMEEAEADGTMEFQALMRYLEG